MNLFGRLALIGLAVTASLAAPATTAMAEEPATVKEEANLRFQPTTKSPVLEELPAGTRVDVLCWEKGEPTYGTDKYGSMWLFTEFGGWVHSMLLTPVDVDECEDTIAVPGGFFYKNCDAAPGQVHSTEPGYGPHLDRDRDGVGCEWNDE
jgi:hypothetical protein